MGSKTKIEWTAGDDGAMGATWNPIRGCSMVSHGCTNCYAMHVAARFSDSGQPYEGLAIRDPARWTGKVVLVEKHIADPLRWQKPRRIFVNSTSDLFHENLKYEDIDRVFAAMADCCIRGKGHVFQILTKRPARMLSYISQTEQRRNWIAGWLKGNHLRQAASLDTMLAADLWPLPQVWLGVSVEDQKTADERIPLLLQTPAAVHFVSYEPALDAVDFARWMDPLGHLDRFYREQIDKGMFNDDQVSSLRRSTISWLICGGESGTGARPFNIWWARHALQQCHETGTPAFMKQLGAKPYWDTVGGLGEWPKHVTFTRTGEPHKDAKDWIGLHDRKGGDPSEWEEDLRVRQFPGGQSDRS